MHSFSREVSGPGLCQSRDPGRAKVRSTQKAQEHWVGKGRAFLSILYASPENEKSALRVSSSSEC